MHTYRRRFIALFLTFSISILSTFPVHATSDTAQNTLSSCYSSDIQTINTLLVKEDSQIVNDIEITSYSTDNVKEYIRDCDSINEITQINDILYIDYIATSGKHVILSYCDDRQAGVAVYDPVSDTIDEQNYLANTTTHVENFFGGSHYELTDEQYSAICNAFNQNDISALYEIPRIEIEQSSDSLKVRPAMNATAASSVKDNFVDASEQFPPYTKRVVLISERYISDLQDTAVVKVKESMNQYVLKEADSCMFKATTGLAVIGAFLGSPKIAALVVTIMGIALSAADQIQEDIRVTRSATTEYMGAREGYVYDKTVFHDDVRVCFNSAKGELAGGLNNKGEFTWIDHVPSKAFDTPASTIADKAENLYRADIVMNGYCSLYYPD